MTGNRIVLAFGGHPLWATMIDPQEFRDSYSLPPEAAAEVCADLHRLWQGGRRPSGTLTAAVALLVPPPLKHTRVGEGYLVSPWSMRRPERYVIYRLLSGVEIGPLVWRSWR